MVVVAGVDNPTRRYASWLAETYDTQVVSTDNPARPSLGADVVIEPISRDDLLKTVETARRVTEYEDAVEELLSLTVRRRELREFLGPDRVDDSTEFVRVSRRIEKLHDRIDGTLADVESQYVELLGSGQQRLTDRGARTEE